MLSVLDHAKADALVCILFSWFDFKLVINKFFRKLFMFTGNGLSNRIIPKIVHLTYSLQ